MKITEKAIEKLAPKVQEATGQLVDNYLWDSTQPGFGVRCFPSGKRAFVVKYTLASDQQRKMSLGPAGRGMLETARREAATILMKAKAGQDIAGDKQKAREAAKVEEKRDTPLGKHVDSFLKEKEKIIKPSTFRELRRYLKVTLAPLHDRRPEDVKRADLKPLVGALASQGKRVAADRAKTAFVQFFNELVDGEFCNGNPAAGLRSRQIDGDGERLHYHTMDELQPIWRATADHSEYSAIIRLLVLTGCRREEIGGLRWDEINWTKRQILLIAKTGRTKKRDRIVFLSEPAMEILQSFAPRPNHVHVFGQRPGSGFSGWSKAKIALDKRIDENLAPWVVHDFRRTFETNASMLELADDRIIHAATGHWSKVKQGEQKVYNLNEYEPQRRKLMDDWGKAVLVSTKR